MKAGRQAQSITISEILQLKLNLKTNTDFFDKAKKIQRRVFSFLSYLKTDKVQVI
jgi:hypothetical protein